MDGRYDVVIVGARCAGASLAALLARRGLSVAVLDRDRLPSDQVLSTHTIHPPGLDVLDEIGVGDAVRRGCPPSSRLRLGKNDASIVLQFAEGRADYCPRRHRLDGLLQQAAANAGANVIDVCRVTSLIREDGRVAGVRASREGVELEFRAPLVVGADGRHSTIAKLVDAEEYLGYDAPRAMYWSYWDAPPVWRDESRYPFDFYVANRHGAARVIFQTDDDRLLIGGVPPLEEARGWRGSPLAALTAYLAKDPVTAPLVADRAPAEPVRGTISERYFFRRAAGPGWVLAGDAGHHKDFLIGDGITEALLQVRSLVPAILAGTDAALERWWRERDVRALPMFCFASDEGAAAPPKFLQTVVFDRVARDASLQRRMTEVMEHAVSPYDVFRLPEIVTWTLVAALKGRPQVIPEFLAMGKRAADVRKELVSRKALLEAMGEAARTEPAAV
jgi:menaquinone-9 beta-reductase